MKLLNIIISGALLVTATAFAANPPTLYVKDGKNLLDVAEMIENEIEVQTHYGFEDFCYKGDSFAVVMKMQGWKQSGFFFSGGGGGFVLKKLKVNRGIASYDIAMTLEDEVVPGEFRNVIIKPCP